jgi:hypothetical protein
MLTISALIAELTFIAIDELTMAFIILVLAIITGVVNLIHS